MSPWHPVTTRSPCCWVPYWKLLFFSSVQPPCNSVCHKVTPYHNKVTDSSEFDKCSSSSVSHLVLTGTEGALLHRKIRALFKFKRMWQNAEEKGLSKWNSITTRSLTRLKWKSFLLHQWATSLCHICFNHGLLSKQGDWLVKKSSVPFPCDNICFSNLVASTV